MSLDYVKFTPGFEQFMPKEYKDMVEHGPFGKKTTVSQMGTFKEILEEHPMCAGCAMTLFIRLAIIAFPNPEDTITVGTAGCGLRAFGTEQEGGGHVVDVDGVNQRFAAIDQAGASLFNGNEEAEQVQIAGAIDQSRTRYADGQAVFFPGIEREQLAFQLAFFVGIGGREGGILGGGRFACYTVNAGRAAMHDTLQRTLALAGF